MELDREPTDDEWCAAAGKINMEAIRLAIEDGVEAKNQLVTSNLRMVQGVVNLYIRNGLGSQYNAADLMQEGIVVSNELEKHQILSNPYRHTHIFPNCFFFIYEISFWFVLFLWNVLGTHSCGRKV